VSKADPIRRLVHAFSRLPGIGEKTAQRLAFFVMHADDEVARDLSEALAEVKRTVGLCSICCNLTEIDPCRICADARRDAGTICVVENVQSLLAVERTSEFRGRYHVLHGLWSPLAGIGPEQLHIKELIARLKPDAVDEVIVATPSNIDGDATALYLQRLVTPLHIRCTRIASGVPIGAELEYADQVTLARALSGRREM
jgi:recombination protein RecR